MKRALIPVLTLVLLSACTASKPETQVVRVYAAVDQEIAEEVFKAFTADTGIQVEAVYDSEAAKTAGLAKRLELEQEQPTADVWWSGESLYTAMLDKRGCLAPLPADVPRASREMGGENWAAFAARIRVLVYDERHWPAGLDKPDSIEWLADARLRGKCAIANPLFGTTATQFTALRATPDGEALLRRMQGNEPQVVASNSAVVRAVAQGDALLGITDTDDVLILREQHPGLRFVIPDQGEGMRGAVVTPASAAIVKGCPHPEAAAKLVRWLAGKSGETAMARSPMRNLPIVSDAEPPAELPPRGKLRLTPVDYPSLVANWDDQLGWLKSTFQP